MSTSGVRATRTEPRRISVATGSTTQSRVRLIGERDRHMAYEPGKTATVHTPGGDLEMTIRPATEGASAFEIGKLLSTSGLTTYDPGYGNTAPVSSAITYIDGDAGILRYRGYPIDQLAEKSTFLETSYLLIYGELPTQDQLAAFTNKISRHTLLHEDMKLFFNGFPRDAHPMPVLSSAVSALSTFYQDNLDPFDDDAVELSTVRLLAKLPTIAAYAYKKSIGQPFLYPDNSLGLVENFLRMTFGFPAEPYQADPEFVKALDLLLILHADHEQNCSTSTVRLVGSAQANLFASVSAGINALFGPLHGGANEAVLKMLGVTDPLLDIAKALEERALADDYFIERKLYPNVDFYTGVIYRAMGFPTKMFTVLFALGRLPGWIAHWREMINDPSTKIGRPRQLYIGASERPY